MSPSSRDVALSGPFAAIQRDVLELIATGAPRDAVLDRLATGVEGLLGEGLVSIQVVDGPVLRHVAAPSLPAPYLAAIDGLPISPTLGSCLAAAATGLPVIVEDVTTHPNWDGYGDFAASHGLFACWSTPVLAPEGEVLGTFAVYYARPMGPPAAALDIVASATAMASIVMRHERTQQALRLNEDRFRQMAESIDDVFWLQDADSLAVRYVSPAFEAVWGLPCSALYADAHAALELVLPEDRGTLQAALAATTRRVEAEFRIRRPDGRVRSLHGQRFPVFEQGRLVRLVGVVRDVTERRQLEQQLLQAQRVETLGTLASGIAHDLNNVLTPIMMAASSLRDEVDDETRLVLVRAIEDSTARAAAMVQQVLAFARGADGQQVPIIVPDVVDEVIRLLRDTVPRSIDLRSEWPDDLPPVLGDATELHQVVLNLVINARDAMPTGGRVTLSLETTRLPPGLASGAVTRPADADERDRQYLCLTVADTGTGIPADLHDRIFDPFYTTKAIGQGSGLGLSTVLAVVKRHSGHVTVESVMGSGTTFRIYLPAITEASAPAPRPRTSASTDARSATARVLVVDDEAAILEVMRVGLGRAGYDVRIASSGPEALGILAAFGGAVDVLLFDLMMAGMDGWTLARAVRGRYPQVTLVAATGLPTEPLAQQLRAAGVTHCLPKPYDLARIRQLVADHLPARPAPD